VKVLALASSLCTHEVSSFIVLRSSYLSLQKYLADIANSKSTQTI